MKIRGHYGIAAVAGQDMDEVWMWQKMLTDRLRSTKTSPIPRTETRRQEMTQASSRELKD